MNSRVAKRSPGAGPTGRANGPVVRCCRAVHEAGDGRLTARPATHAAYTKLADDDANVRGRRGPDMASMHAIDRIRPSAAWGAMAAFALMCCAAAATFASPPVAGDHAVGT